MHELVDLFTIIRDSIRDTTMKPTRITQCTERWPDFKTYIVKVDHGDSSGVSNYLVTVENGQAEVQEMAFITPKFVWTLHMEEKEAQEAYPFS